MAEVLGRSGFLASTVTNCAPPDTGNMEVLARYGNAEQKKKWLVPLLNGSIRSAFSMTEYGTASSDATNVGTSMRVEGDQIVINGRKWCPSALFVFRAICSDLTSSPCSRWISGATHVECAVHLVVGKSDPTNKNRHIQQSIVIVPANTPGVKVVRPMHVMGFDDAPDGHGEIIYDNVRVPVSNVVGGWGRGFEILQGRLGCEPFFLL
jgi:acyl-CoA dehydrogenase